MTPAVRWVVSNACGDMRSIVHGRNNANNDSLIRTQSGDTRLDASACKWPSRVDLPAQSSSHSQQLALRCAPHIHFICIYFVTQKGSETPCNASMWQQYPYMATSNRSPASVASVCNCGKRDQHLTAAYTSSAATNSASRATSLDAADCWSAAVGGESAEGGSHDDGSSGRNAAARTGHMLSRDGVGTSYSAAIRHSRRPST